MLFRSFDDRVDDYEVADAIMKIYKLSKKQRKEMGLKGREWAIKNLSSEIMCKKMIDGIEKSIDNFKPKKRFDLYKII